MAQTVQEIEDDIIAAKNAQPALAIWNSPSATARWRLWTYVTALAHHKLQKVMDLFRTEVRAYAAQQIVGTEDWYQGLAIQWGEDELGVTLRASCRSVAAKVFLKVARVVGGLTQNISATQVADLRTYIYQKEMAGVDIEVISQTADTVGLVMEVLHSSSNAVALRAAIKVAVKAYLASLDFDAVLSKTLLAFAVKEVPGVLDASVQELTVSRGLGYVPVVGNTVAPDAGYFELGVVAGNDLLTLNLIG